MSIKLLSSSILSADFGCLADQIKQAEAAGVDWIHVDVMDGVFVDSITMGPVIVEACRRVTQLPIDVHLMVENPARHIPQFAEAGANLLSIHIETCPHIHRDLMKIKSFGCKAGLVVNPGTSLSTIEHIVSAADLVLLMSVNPGAAGQKFIPETMEKIRALRQMITERKLGTMIEVDGGINPANIKDVSLAGADVFVVASAIFHAPEGIGPAVNSLKSALK